LGIEAMCSVDSSRFVSGRITKIDTASNHLREDELAILCVDDDLAALG